MQAIALLHPHHPPTFRLLVSTYSKKLGCGIAAAKNATDHSRCIHAAFTKGSAGNSEAYVRTLNNVVLQVVANSTWTTDQGQWPYLRSCGESWQHRRRTRQDSRDRISPLRRGFERVSRSGSRSLTNIAGTKFGHDLVKKLPDTLEELGYRPVHWVRGLFCRAHTRTPVECE